MGWAKEAWIEETIFTMNIDLHKDNFLMDFENWCLQNRWDARKKIPTGPDRYKNPEWAAMMERECHFSDTNFEEYCAWCQAGGGDEWFQEEGTEIPPPTEEQLQRLSELVNAPIIFRSGVTRTQSATP